MKKNPLVSIGIPTFNRVDLLIVAVESVLRQTYDNIELIISDNVSTDGTINYLKNLEIELPLKVLFQDQNIGMRGNWNACINAANGDYFLLLSDDDILNEMAIALLVNACLKANNLGFCYGRVEPIGGNLRLNYNSPSDENGSEWLQGYLNGQRDPFPSATLLPLAITRDLGGYPDVGYTTDVALLLRLSINRQIFFVNEIVCQYRIHNGALSKDFAMIESTVLQLNWLNSEDFLSNKIKQKITKNYHWYITKWLFIMRLSGQIEQSELAYKQLIKLKPRLTIQIFVKFKNSKLFLAVLRMIIKVKNKDFY